MPLFAALLATAALAVPAASPDSSPCALDAAQAAWIQSGLDSWERASRDLLGLDPEPLPWIVLFDSRCAFHVGAVADLAPLPALALDLRLRFAGRPVTALAVAHDPELWLPNGDRVDVQPFAVTSLYAGGTSTFFALALPSYWREGPAAREPDLERFFHGVMAHELVHTRQLVAVTARIRALHERSTFPAGIDDDVVENTFRDVPGFREAYLAESALLEEAVAADDLATVRQRVARALAAMRSRRAAYYAGERAVYAELEDLFLAMEGIAVWSHFRTSQIDAEVSFKSAGNVSWSQAEGLLLFRLIDRLVPEWQKLIFGAAPPSPLAVLDAVLAAPAPGA